MRVIRDGRVRFRVVFSQGAVQTHCARCGMVGVCYHELQLRGAGRRGWYRVAYICPTCVPFFTADRLQLQVVRG